MSKIKVIWQTLENTPFQVYKLNQFLLFHTRKRIISWAITHIIEDVNSLTFGESINVGCFMEMEKIASEHLHKRDLSMRKIGHFHNGVIYYNYQNPSVFCFLVQIRDIG